MEDLLERPRLEHVDLEDQQAQAAALAFEIGRFAIAAEPQSPISLQVLNLTANVRPSRLPYFAR